MSDQMNMDQILNTEKSITLSTGEVKLKQLSFVDFTTATDLYSMMFGGIVAINEVSEINEELIYKEFPVVITNLYANGDTGKELVLKFLNLFTTITGKQIEKFKFADIQLLWKTIYDENKIPFDTRLKDMKATGSLARMKENILTSYLSSTEQE